MNDRYIYKVLYGALLKSLYCNYIQYQVQYNLNKINNTKLLNEKKSRKIQVETKLSLTDRSDNVRFNKSHSFSSKQFTFAIFQRNRYP